MTARNKLFLRSFVEGRSFDTVDLAPNPGVIESGVPLGKVTATGKYRRADKDATDGSENALVIANSAPDKIFTTRVVVTAREAEIDTAFVDWSDVVKADAIASITEASDTLVFRA